VLLRLARRFGSWSRNYYDPFDSGNTSCLDYNAPLGGVGISGGELSWLENGLTDLNANIISEVTYAQTHDTHLVSAWLTSAARCRA